MQLRSVRNNYNFRRERLRRIIADYTFLMLNTSQCRTVTVQSPWGAGGQPGLRCGFLKWDPDLEDDRSRNRNLPGVLPSPFPHLSPEVPCYSQMVFSSLFVSWGFLLVKCSHDLLYYAYSALWDSWHVSHPHYLPCAEKLTKRRVICARKQLNFNFIISSDLP